MVNKSEICKPQITKNLQEIDIDRIVIKETPEPILGRPEQGKAEKMKTSVTTIRLNGNCKQDLKQNTHKVGKLDVTKIEERRAEIQKSEKENILYNSKKVNQLTIIFEAATVIKR